MFGKPIPALIGILVAVATAGCSDPVGTQTAEVRMGSFTFPALASSLAPIVKAQGLDAANGYHLEIVPYGNVATYYAGLVSSEVDTLPGGPLVFQRMLEQGIPIVATNSYASLASLVVIANDPAIQQLGDLKGRRLAADMGSSEFLILQMMARRQGLHTGSDIEVLQTTPAAARAHLLTGEADAILTFEPTATMALADNPASHIVVDGQSGWQTISPLPGWLLISLFRTDFANQYPELVRAYSRSLVEAAEYVKNQPEDSDRIVSSALNIAEGIFLRAVSQGRIQFRIETAASQREALDQMFRLGVESGFNKRLPGPESFFQ